MKSAKMSTIPRLRSGWRGLRLISAECPCRAILVVAMGLMVCVGRVSGAVPMGTAFTYQGRLMDANSAADGLYDLQFELYSDPCLSFAAYKVGGTVTIDDLDVVDGYFTVELDFGTWGVFTGDARWLQIGVRPGDSDDTINYTFLGPRQEVTPAPYALYAASGPGVPVPLALSGSSPDPIISGTNFGAGSAVYGKATNTGEEDNHGGYFESAGSDSSGVYGKATGLWGHGVYGTATSSKGRGVYGRASGQDGMGVYGYASNMGDVTNYGGYFLARGEQGRGVYGEATDTGDVGKPVANYGGYFLARGAWGAGVHGEATGAYGAGVRGEHSPSGNHGYIGTSGAGVYGWSDSDKGVYGHSNSGYGVYGFSDGYAGYFRGKVHITGTLSKGGGSFKIDHPLDPENKYLQHSFIESPDMMNVYNGNVLLDKNGEAVVKLPAYFEALNCDFRYQLTAIGTPAPNLYITEEISNNRFKIAGGKKGMKVSWQVTGIRQDAYAKANRIVVEENKPAEERGYYLHPTAYGLPEEKGIESVRNPRVSETRQVAKGDVSYETD